MISPSRSEEASAGRQPGVDTPRRLSDHSLMADDEMRPDIAAAWARVTNKIGKKRDIRKLPEYLNGGETVLAIAGGKVGTNLGLLVATDRRAMFVSEGVINHTFEDFPYDRINTVTSSRGMMLAKIMINTGGANRIIEDVAKAAAEPIAAVIRERVEAVTRERYRQPAPTPSPQPPPSPGLSLASQLRELAELRDQGVLTSDEFEAQKARLLNS